MRGFRALALAQWKLFVRDPAAFFFTLVFPTLLLLLVGAIWGNSPDPNYGDGRFGAVDAAVPAYAGLILGTTGFLGIPIATAGLRQHKVLRRFRATPMSPLTYFAAEILVALASALLGAALVVVVGVAFFGLRFDGTVPAAIGGFVLSALALFALGYVLASVAPTERTAQALGQVLYFPMLFLSGVTFPPELMPEWLRRISEVLPMTQVVEVMQGAWFGQGIGSLWGQIAALVVMLVCGVVASALLFRWE
jgi:ABC-2 type transport system permease protein